MKKIALYQWIIGSLLMINGGVVPSTQAMDVVHKWCPPEAKVQTEQFTLSADALFHFDKWKLGDMLVAGKSALDQLIQHLQQYESIEKITVVGHTDRLGSEQYNARLGQRRADTVKSYLQQGNVTAPIMANSAGESQPVTKECQGSKPTPELIACLQPDRRVVVEISGVKKVAQ